MKVYVVEHGNYSDRHVVAVMDSEEKANEIASQECYGIVTAYNVNELGDRILQGYRRWRISFWSGLDQLYEAEHDYDPFDFTEETPCENSTPRSDYEAKERGLILLVNKRAGMASYWQFIVFARDEAEAIKIASEQRARRIVQHVP